MLTSFIVENSSSITETAGNLVTMSVGGAATGGLVSYFLGNRIIERLVKLETQMESLITTKSASIENVQLIVESEIRKMVKPESLK